MNMRGGGGGMAAHARLLLLFALTPSSTGSVPPWSCASCATGGKAACANGTAGVFEHAQCEDDPAVPGFNCTVRSAGYDTPPSPEHGTVYVGSTDFNADRYSRPPVVHASNMDYPPAQWP